MTSTVRRATSAAQRVTFSLQREMFLAQSITSIAHTRSMKIVPQWEMHFKLKDDLCSSEYKACNARERHLQVRG